MLTKLTVAVILQYIHTSNYYVVYFNIVLYVNYVSIETGKNKMFKCLNRSLITAW